MELEFYDFESGLEQGFKSLLDSAGLAVRIADDVDEGELPDECLTLEIDAGGVNSNEHLNDDGVYDNYTGSLVVTVKSKRSPSDEKSTSADLRTRQAQLVAMTRKALEEIDNSKIDEHWPNRHAPTKIKPQSTERENDNLQKMTTLTYELQFRIT